MSTIPPLSGVNALSYIPSQQQSSTDTRAAMQAGQQTGGSAIKVGEQAVQGTVASEKQAASRDSLEKASSQVQELFKLTQSELKISIDDDLGVQVVKIMDISTDEVIRQIPSEEMLELAKSLDKVLGLLVRDKA
ncbi:flagellar protein FlaG [Laribacter hongkongensis]|uniref:flagellar protein FlaG n=1 Tax=Laribacter hongkongensis TaxID=168471 RepID=UPI001EFE27FF|nr:flagellar protein FlaG [Laribacter hongkongensis]MCG8996162.1 flagellar protein FlaG [Laribacter hongkongensis]MCG9011086.1 flagellar protein FlaG [Laribacter hongkongensis]MCG9023212.1 flagellar protein FlaG [Laribacter hongkongensis]MCG9048188.1 flagellar protein FlaG [Laribacter hongkongensis]MCG9074435.1 flagellar protein FlaG [Laribacter hongkongensis]